MLSLFPSQDNPADCTWGDTLAGDDAFRHGRREGAGDGRGAVAVRAGQGTKRAGGTLGGWRIGMGLRAENWTGVCLGEDGSLVFGKPPATMAKSSGAGWRAIAG